MSSGTVQGFALAVVVWVGIKILDRALDAIFGRRIVQPTKIIMSRKIKGFWTRVDPIESSFLFSLSPRSNITVSEVTTMLDEVFQRVESTSRGRLQTESPMWNETDGRVSVGHVDSKREYTIDIHIAEEGDHEVDDSDTPVENRNVKSMSFEVKFEFSYPKMESELSNLGVLTTSLLDCLEEEFQGVSSEAKIVLHPISGGLSVDEWLGEEEQEVSLLLKEDEGGVKKTEVEVFSDRVTLHPPYFKMDSEIMNHIRVLVLNYHIDSKKLPVRSILPDSMEKRL